MTPTRPHPKDRPSPGKPARPDPVQEMEELAGAGDFGSVLQWYFTLPPGACSFGRLDRLLRGAIDRAAGQSGHRFTRNVYRQTLFFLTYVQLRLEACVMDGLRRADDHAHPRGGGVPEDVRAILPQLERLMRLSGELSLGWASATRLWGLARRGRPAPPRQARKQGRSRDPLQKLVAEDDLGREGGTFGGVGPRGPL
jgi:hypothetical protein